MDEKFSVIKYNYVSPHKRQYDVKSIHVQCIKCFQSHDKLSLKLNVGISIPFWQLNALRLKIQGDIHIRGSGILLQSYLNFQRQIGNHRAISITNNE